MTGMRPYFMLGLAAEIDTLLREPLPTGEDPRATFHARRAQYLIAVAKWTAVFATMPQTAPCTAAREEV